MGQCTVPLLVHLLTTDCKLLLQKIGEKRNARLLPLSVGSIAQLHDCDREYSRLSICVPPTSAPPNSLSNSPIKTHLSDPCHPPTHLLPVLLNSGATVIGAFPPPQPPLCHHPLPTHPSHLALRPVQHLGPKAGRQAALRFLILPNSGHSGHCLHSSCAHSADWAPR